MPVSVPVFVAAIQQVHDLFQHYEFSQSEVEKCGLNLRLQWALVNLSECLTLLTRELGPSDYDCSCDGVN